MLTNDTTAILTDDQLDDMAAECLRDMYTTRPDATASDTDVDGIIQWS